MAASERAICCLAMRKNVLQLFLVLFALASASVQVAGPYFEPSMHMPC